MAGDFMFVDRSRMKKAKTIIATLLMLTTHAGLVLQENSLNDEKMIFSTDSIEESNITATQVVTGYAHTCVLYSDGDVSCWGDNSMNQLNNSEVTYSLEPLNIDYDAPFSFISSGANHTCGVTFEGAAYCWGDNSDGKLGDGTFPSNPIGLDYTWSQPNNSPSGINCVWGQQRTTMGDINGDGLLEVAWMDECNDELTIKTWDGSKFQGGEFFFQAYNDGQSVSFADLTSDGQLEVIVESNEDILVHVFNSGNSDIYNNTTTYNIENAGHRSGTEFSDLDGDGDLDIISINDDYELCISENQLPSNFSVTCEQLSDELSYYYGINVFNYDDSTYFIGTEDNGGYMVAYVLEHDTFTWEEPVWDKLNLTITESDGTTISPRWANQIEDFPNPTDSVMLYLSGDLGGRVVELNSIDDDVLDFTSSDKILTSDYGYAEIGGIFDADGDGDSDILSTVCGSYNCVPTIAINPGNIYDSWDEISVTNGWNGNWQEGYVGLDGMILVVENQQIKSLTINGFSSSLSESLDGYHVTSIAAGNSHTCVTSDSSTSSYCWGNNSHDQLGIGVSNINFSATPMEVSSPGEDLRNVITGGDYTCAEGASSGSMYCWGYNYDGQLGLAPYPTYVTSSFDEVSGVSNDWDSGLEPSAMNELLGFNMFPYDSSDGPVILADHLFYSSQIKNQIVNVPTDSDNHSYRVEIGYVDVHPNSTASITFNYDDNSSNSYTFYGNGGLTFIEIPDSGTNDSTYDVVTRNGGNISDGDVSLWDMNYLMITPLIEGLSSIDIEDNNYSEWQGLLEVSVQESIGHDVNNNTPIFIPDLTYNGNYENNYFAFKNGSKVKFDFSESIYGISELQFDTQDIMSFDNYTWKSSLYDYSLDRLDQIKDDDLTIEINSTSAATDESHFVEIGYVDVHPNGSASIKFVYSNGTEDSFVFYGNGGLTFEETHETLKYNNQTFQQNNYTFIDFDEVNTTESFDDATLANSQYSSLGLNIEVDVPNTAYIINSTGALIDESEPNVISFYDSESLNGSVGFSFDFPINTFSIDNICLVSCNISLSAYTDYNYSNVSNLYDTIHITSGNNTNGTITQAFGWSNLPDVVYVQVVWTDMLYVIMDNLNFSTLYEYEEEFSYSSPHNYTITTRNGGNNIGDASTWDSNYLLIQTHPNSSAGYLERIIIEDDGYAEWQGLLEVSAYYMTHTDVSNHQGDHLNHWNHDGADFAIVEYHSEDNNAMSAITSVNWTEAWNTFSANDSTVNVPFLSTSYSSDYDNLVLSKTNSCAISSLGELNCLNMTSGIMGLTDLLSVTPTHLSVGNMFTCAVVDNQESIQPCWGDENSSLVSSGGLNIPTGKEVTSLSTGMSNDHICAILDDDTITCSGNNDRYQLGDTWTWMDDYTESTQIQIGDSILGSMEVIGDVDEFYLDLEIDDVVSIFLNSTGDSAGNSDTFLTISESSGKPIENDNTADVVYIDNNTTTNPLDSKLIYSMKDNGTLLIMVGGFGEESGDYMLEVNTFYDDYPASPFNAPWIDTSGTIEAVAEFIGDIDSFKFNLSKNEVLSMNIVTAANSDDYTMEDTPDFSITTPNGQLITQSSTLFKVNQEPNYTKVIYEAEETGTYLLSINSTGPIVDNFDFFDSSIWESPSSRYAYSSGNLLVSGDSSNQDELMMMNQVFEAPLTIKGILDKEQNCNDQFIVISTGTDARWDWGPGEDVAKFVWNCGEKNIYGQNSQSGTSCSTYRTYAIEIEITEDGLTFLDDYCDDLTLADNLASEGPFYVYIGADDDGGTAKWDYFETSVGGGSTGSYQLAFDTFEDDYPSFNDFSIEHGDENTGKIDYQGDTDSFFLNVTSGELILIDVDTVTENTEGTFSNAIGGWFENFGGKYVQTSSCSDIGELNNLTGNNGIFEQAFSTTVSDGFTGDEVTHCAIKTNSYTTQVNNSYDMAFDPAYRPGGTNSEGHAIDSYDYTQCLTSMDYTCGDSFRWAYELNEAIGIDDLFYFRQTNGELHLFVQDSSDMGYLNGLMNKQDQDVDYSTNGSFNTWGDYIGITSTGIFEIIITGETNSSYTITSQKMVDDYGNYTQNAQYLHMGDALVSGEINFNGDTDLFRITPGSGDNYTIYSDQNITIEVYDSSMTTVAFQDSNNISTFVANGEDYYVMVSGTVVEYDINSIWNNERDIVLLTQTSSENGTVCYNNYWSCDISTNFVYGWNNLTFGTYNMTNESGSTEITASVYADDILVNTFSVSSESHLNDITIQVPIWADNQTCSFVVDVSFDFEISELNWIDTFYHLCEELTPEVYDEQLNSGEVSGINLINGTNDYYVSLTNLTLGQDYTLNFNYSVDDSEVQTQSRTVSPYWVQSSELSFVDEEFNFFITPYSCTIDLIVSITNTTGFTTDLTNYELEGPCYDIPVTELGDIEIVNDNLNISSLIFDNSSVSSSISVGSEYEYYFTLEALNTTDSWEELGETFILEYSVYLDGYLELNDSIYMGAFSLEDQDFNTLGFTITPYMCNVMLNANLIGDSGGIIDSLSLSLNAPCEEQPQPDISAIYVYDKDWDFDHLVYSNGVNFYNTSGTEVNYTLPSSESPNENNVKIDVMLVNTSNIWIDTPTVYNISYHVSIDELEVLNETREANEGMNVFFYSSPFTVSPYDCEIEILIDITYDGGQFLDNKSVMMDGPCEEVPEPEFQDFHLIDSASEWSHFEPVFSDGMDINVSASDSPESFNYYFDMTLANANNEWINTSSTFNMTYSISVDGEEMMDSFMEVGTADFMYFLTDSFSISPYSCNVYLSAEMMDESGTTVDELYANLSAPCLEIPEIEIVSIYEYSHDIGWQNITTENGTANTSVSSEFPLHYFGVGISNTSNPWFDLGNELNMTWEISIDEEYPISGYYNKAPSEDIAYLYSTGFAVSPYDCLVEFDAMIANSNGDEIGLVSTSVNAPCEESPVAELGLISLYDEIDQDWLDLDNNATLPSSTNLLSNTFSLSFEILNSTDVWEGDSILNVVYSLILDGETTIEENITVSGSEDLSIIGSSFDINPYSCVGELHVYIYDNGSLLDAITLALNAPCEEVPTPSMEYFNFYDSNNYYTMDSENISASTSPDQGLGFDIEMDNTYSQWIDMGEYYNMSMEIVVDGVSMFVGDYSTPNFYDEEYNPNGYTYFYDYDMLAISPYYCEMVVTYAITNEAGDLVANDTLTYSLPCEEVPSPIILDLGLYANNETLYNYSAVGDNFTLTEESIMIGSLAIALDYGSFYYLNQTITVNGVVNAEYSSYLSPWDADEQEIYGTIYDYLVYGVDIYDCQIIYEVTLSDGNNTLDSKSWILQGPCELDDDGDGIPNGLDSFPLNPDSSSDMDDDGIADSEDAFPNDANETIDSDGDGQGDNSDNDDDNDGIIDSADLFPYDGSEYLDIDGDGIGDNADLDDDNDNIPDSLDLFPEDATEYADFDNDGEGDNADLDDDNDGTLDLQDAFPYDSSEYIDTDSDGLGDNRDKDDDDDNWLDTKEINCGADPLSESDMPVDTDGDGTCDSIDTDDDNDGLLDVDESTTNSLLWDTDGDNYGDSVDLFPLDSTEWADYDNDGKGDNSDDIISDTYSSADEPMMYIAGAAAASFLAAIVIGKVAFGGKTAVTTTTSSKSKNPETEDLDFDDL